MTQSPPDRERLAYVVHEVRSPVAALAALSETLSETRDPGVIRRLVVLALGACRGIERLLDHTALESLQLVPVDVGQLARDAAEAASLAGAPVRHDVEAALPEIVGDPQRLRQALDNLVGNALVHTPPGTEVVISASLREGAVELAVADAGNGIPLAEQARIFERGVRLHPDRPGSGLGLAVARAVAEAHGGTLTLRSEVGAGATFTIALPPRT